MTADDGAIAIDAPRDGMPIDAPPSEVCSSAGWCQAIMPPSYAWAMSITPSGEPWIAAYGVDKKTPTSWQSYDPQWADLANPFVFHTELYSVHAVSSTDVWVGGRQGYVGHFDGLTFHELRPASPWPLGIWGAAANDVWVLYDSGLRYHWNGTTLEGKPTSEVRYVGAWGTAANDVWGWGETVIDTQYKPAIDHFDGTTWTRTVVPGFGKVISFWAASPTDLYAVVSLNSTTRVVHGDGATWTTLTDASLAQIYAVWGRSANEVWAVGAQGRIARFDGNAWSVSASGTTKSLSEIAGTATTLWVAGDGVALHRP